MLSIDQTIESQCLPTILCHAHVTAQVLGDRFVFAWNNPNAIVVARNYALPSRFAVLSLLGGTVLLFAPNLTEHVGCNEATMCK